MTRPTKIISGGQTGCDLGALRAGRILSIQTGGWMPRGFRTELGSRPWMAKMYGMREHADHRYPARTLENVRESDLTLLFGDLTEPGTRLTARLCADLGKPVVTNPTVDFLAHVFDHTQPAAVVNVAGNRESGNRGIEEYVVWMLVAAWGTVEQLAQHPPPKFMPRIR